MDAEPPSAGNGPDTSLMAVAFDRVPVGLALLARDGSVTRANWEMVQLLGDEVTGWESFPTAVRAAVTHSRGRATTRFGLQELPTRPGVLVTWTVRSGPDGGWVVQAEDVTALHRLHGSTRATAERLGMVAALHRHVEQTEFDRDFTATIEMIADRARVLIGAGMIGIGRIDGPQVIYRLMAGRTESAGILTRTDHSLSGRCITSGLSLVCHDTEL